VILGPIVIPLLRCLPVEMALSATNLLLLLLPLVDHSWAWGRCIDIYKFWWELLRQTEAAYFWWSGAFSSTAGWKMYQGNNIGKSCNMDPAWLLLWKREIRLEKHRLQKHFNRLLACKTSGCHRLIRYSSALYLIHATHIATAE